MALRPSTLVTLGLATAIILAAVFILFWSEDRTFVQTTSTVHFETCDSKKRLKAEIELQRNQVSASLNGLQEKYQKLVCTTNQQGGTSETGGWCNTGVESQHVTDVSLAKGLAELLLNKTVVGLGDGLGKYRRLLLDSGAVKRYDVYHGIPNIETITSGQVSFLDLTIQQYWLPVYDWVVILEVMEHIPAQFENIVLDNVARLTSSGVVLSWAVKGDDCINHINCQSSKHVLRAMQQRGFVPDSAGSLKLQKAASSWWLNKNIQVFRRCC